jgi:hypothetical protein
MIPEELHALKIDRIASDDCLLAMWWLGPTTIRRITTLRRSEFGPGDKEAAQAGILP